MNEDELAAHRVVATKGCVHLVPRTQDGVPAEEYFGKNCPSDLVGAWVYRLDDCTPVIVHDHPDSENHG